MPLYENYGQALRCLRLSNPHGEMPVYHIHPHWELYYCAAPHQQITFVNSQTVTYTQPLAILSSPFSQHGTKVPRTSVRYERDILYFGDDFLAVMPPALFPLDEFAGSTACFFPLCDADCAMLSPLVDQLAAAPGEAEKMLLFALFFKRLCTAVPDEARHYIGDANSYIQDVMRYIVEHLAEPLSVNDLAARFYVGHDKLSRDFRRYTNTTVHRFIANLRFARACELLRATPALSVTEVAHRCGFANPYYFTDFFKSHTGQTPSQYAREKRTKKGRHQA